MIPTKGWSIFSGLPRRQLHFKNVQFILNLLERLRHISLEIHVVAWDRHKHGVELNRLTGS
jgi:hypothetical protein